MAGNGLSVAVDDLQIFKYGCPGVPGKPVLDCDFERDTCAWWNVDSTVENENVDWVIRTPKNGGLSLGGPPVDSTLGTDEGSYLLLESNIRDEDDVRTKSKAVFASQPLKPNITYCFTWLTYAPQPYGTSYTVMYHDLVTLEVGKLCNAWTCDWMGQGGSGDHWENHHVPVFHNNPYNIYLVGSLEADVTVPLAVDDIQLREGLCLPDPPATFNCHDGGTIPTEEVCNMKKDCGDGSDELECGSCSFEEGECGWANQANTEFYWYWQDGSEPCQDLDCTGGDHTLVNDNQTFGHFVYLQHQDGEPSGVPTFKGPSVNSVFSSCMFKFW